MKRPWYIWLSVPAFLVLAFVTNIRALCKKPFRLTRWLHILGKVLFLFVFVLMLPMIALHLVLTLLTSVSSVFLWVDMVAVLVYFYIIGVYMNTSLVRWAQINLSDASADELLNLQTRAQGKHVAIVVGGVIAAIVLALILCILFLRKSSISVEEFYAAMEQENLTVQDAAEQLENADPWFVANTESYTLAGNSDLRIEFQQMTSSESAQLYFAAMKENLFELYGTEGSLYVSTTVLASSTYALTTDQNYFYMAVVDDTFLFAATRPENQAELKQIIGQIGY